MPHRVPAICGFLSAVLTGFVVAGGLAIYEQHGLTLSAQSNWAPSRTPWGDPDLQGVWNSKTLTPLERSAKYAGREFLRSGSPGVGTGKRRGQGQG